MATEEKKVPATVGQYLASLRETAGILAWCWTEFVNASSRRYIRRALGYAMCSRITSLFYPWLMGLGIQGLISHDANQALFAVFGTGIGQILSTLGEWRYGRNVEWTLGENNRTLERRINQLFFEKELGLHLAEGSLLTQANMEKGYNRFHAVQQSLLFSGIDSTLTLLITWTMLMLLSPIAGLLVTFALLVNLLISLKLNQLVTAGMEPVEERFRVLARRRTERWDGVERVKTAGREAAEIAEMDAEFEATLVEDRQVWNAYIRGTVPRALIAGTFTLTAVGLYAGHEVWIGAMTMTQLVPILTWSGMASQQMRFLARVEREVSWCMPSLRSLRDALTLPVRVKDAPDAVALPNEPVRIEFCGIGHAYEKSGPILRDVSFTIEPGEKVALIGPSGAGKSTLTRLLQRYMDPSYGAILVNGIDLRRIQLSSWRRLIAYIPQRPQVFDGTLRDNLLYGLTRESKREITDEGIWRTARMLRVDFGARLTQGLDTLVGRHGMKLSGGEAQRVMIGAAALKRPRFMVIDEATSSLDAECQADVQQGLERILKGDAGALIIAHRLSTVLRCDKFVVLRPAESDGPQVEAIATSLEELAEISPTFRKLAELEGVSFARSIA